MSSEALGAERLRDLRERVELPGSAGLPDLSPGEWADDARALLAEVARLEQERDEARADYWRDVLAHYQAKVAAEAALAVAREREQRMTDALLDLERNTQRHMEDCCRSDIEWREQMTTHNAASCALDRVRAALVDEPAAATLAEPDQAEAQGEAAASRSGQGSPDGNAQGSGSASAAAEEPRAHIKNCVFHPDHEGSCEDDGEWVAAADGPRCPACGWLVADCNCVAAADEPGETPCR